MEQSSKRPRPKRSMEYSKDDLVAIKKMIDSSTKYDTALFLGITLPTLDNILLRKSGKEAVVLKVRQKLEQAA